MARTLTVPGFVLSSSFRIDVVECPDRRDSRRARRKQEGEEGSSHRGEANLITAPKLCRPGLIDMNKDFRRVF